MKVARLAALGDPIPPTAAALPNGAVAAIGNFDGVHRGHRETLAVARREAARLGAAFAAVTFDPHPARVLRPDRAPKAISTPADREALLAAAGVELLVVLRFREEIANTPAEDFVERLLLGRLGVRAVAQGGNFRFGRGRAGGLDTLRSVGARRGFAVIESPAVRFDGRPVSSTRIREALAAGRPEEAEAMLGRPYELSGAVVPGAGRGRGLGFPTANLLPEGEPLLREGVYAADALPEDEPAAPPPDRAAADARRRAIVHFGPRPTFSDGPSLEAHLLDYAGAPRSLRLRFLRFLRPVRAFPGGGALRRQLERDAAAAADLAGPLPPPSAPTGPRVEALRPSLAGS